MKNILSTSLFVIIIVLSISCQKSDVNPNNHSQTNIDQAIYGKWVIVTAYTGITSSDPKVNSYSKPVYISEKYWEFANDGKLYLKSDSTVNSIPFKVENGNKLILLDGKNLVQTLDFRIEKNKIILTEIMQLTENSKSVDIINLEKP
jgi:hypothetical protein